MNLFGRSEQENTNYKRITKNKIYIKKILKSIFKKIVLQFFTAVLLMATRNVKEIKEIDGFLIGGASKLLLIYKKLL